MKRKVNRNRKWRLFFSHLQDPQHKVDCLDERENLHPANADHAQRRARHKHSELIGKGQQHKGVAHEPVRAVQRAHRLRLVRRAHRSHVLEKIHQQQIGCLILKRFNKKGKSDGTITCLVLLAMPQALCTANNAGPRTRRARRPAECRPPL